MRDEPAAADVAADIAVIGAGPAGLAAAVTAAAAGRDVALVDAAPRPGGQFYRHRAVSSEEEDRRGGRGWETFVRLREGLAAVRYLRGHRVWHIEPGFVVHALAGDGAERGEGGNGDEAAEGGERGGRAVEIRARALILAPGAHDRVLPFPGWDLPGVLTAGAAQALAKGNGVAPGARTVVAGTGPFLLPVAAALATAGSTVAGIFEANRPFGFGAALARHPARLAEAAGYAAALARARIPYLMGRAVVAAHGDDAVTAVTVARLDAGWRPVAGTERLVECDTVAVGHGFAPQLELPLQLGCATRVTAEGDLVVEVDAAQRTSVPGVYAAGEITGIGGAQLALVEGELAALSVLAAGGASAGEMSSAAMSAAAMSAAARAVSGKAVSGKGVAWLLARRRRLRAFAAALGAAYAVRPGWPAWLRDDTVVCRCEEVPYERLVAAVALGATDPRTVKLLSRAGMGWCQGRVCGHATAALTARATGRALAASDLRGLVQRPIAQPIRLGDLAHAPETREKEPP
ncbi:MAG TPA: FAD-dependent oxidoreductase [Streptosporangiaceae bacterium]|nr:FAD-dependent oxidoreductase [Streptosporangiaceae bacterium]